MGGKKRMSAEKLRFSEMSRNSVPRTWSEDEIENIAFRKAYHEVREHKEESWSHNSWNVLVAGLWIAIIIWWSLVIYHVGEYWQPINCVNETDPTNIRWGVYCYRNITETGEHGTICVGVEVPTGRQICPDKSLIKHEMTICKEYWCTYEKDGHVYYRSILPDCPSIHIVEGSKLEVPLTKKDCVG